MATDILQINSILLDENPDMMLLATFDHLTQRQLVLIFTFNGGPLEDKLLVVRFTDAVIFHIPSVIHTRLEASVVFTIADYFEADRYIPPISFDEEEFGQKGCKIFLLTAHSGEETGYYVAAEAVESEWISREDGRRKWNIC